VLMGRHRERDQYGSAGRAAEVTRHYVAALDSREIIVSGCLGCQVGNNQGEV
jgi:hypothetical protein